MKIKINIKPITLVKTHKPDNLRSVFTNHISLGGTTQGVWWGYFDSEFAYGFDIHKINRKVISKKRITKEYNGKIVKTWKYKYEPAKWVISYYKIPLLVLKFMGVELMQHPRHFKLVPKK